MKFPISTGHAARLLCTTEPQLAELVRRGKIEPPPMVFAGRRLWYSDQTLQAAHALGCYSEELAQRIAGPCFADEEPEGEALAPFEELGSADEVQ